MSFSEMENKINNLKSKWLKNEIPLTALTMEIEDHINIFKQHDNYKYLELYINNKIILDNNCKKSSAAQSNVLFLTIASVVAISGLLAEFKSGTILTNLLIAAICLFAYNYCNKHNSKYSREKSFYEFISNTMK